MSPFKTISSVSVYRRCNFKKLVSLTENKFSCKPSLMSDKNIERLFLRGGKNIIIFHTFDFSKIERRNKLHPVFLNFFVIIRKLFSFSFF